MILLIDNYDSFSYNLYQLIGKYDPEIKVVRNDELSVEDVRGLTPKLIVLSPGPGRPEDAGICMEVVKKLRGEIPIFGVCLGHQAICSAYGGTVTYAKKMMHGKVSTARISPESALFQGIEGELEVARYHSLSVDPDTIPENLKVTAQTEDGEVMAVEDMEKKVYGVQFHPESVLTPEGYRVIENLLKETK